MSAVTHSNTALDPVVQEPRSQGRVARSGEPAARARVLCVDDEPSVLEGLQLTLGRRYRVFTATSGVAGLAFLTPDAGINVVVSDMRMPRMNGAEFLARAAMLAPEASRVLLTGETDLDTAVAAVNTGQIFRFLTKPCSPANLLEAVDAAVEQHRMVTAERMVLEQTLRGAVQALSDVLAVSSPAAFGHASRVKRLASEVATSLGLRDLWQVEVAAMLSQLGCVSLPLETVEKIFCGAEITREEEAMAARIPAVTDELLRRIPRLEGVRAILSTAAAPSAEVGAPSDALVPRAAAILRAARAFDALEARGHDADHSVASMRASDARHDPEVIDAIERLRGSKGERAGVREIAVSSLRVGMVIADDVRARDGSLLVTRGYEVTAAFLERVRNFGAARVREPVRVLAANPHL